MIPKIIHYCWVSETIPETIPRNFAKYVQTWKKLSGYQFMLWNFNRFDIHSSPWVMEAWQAKKYAFAADYIRLYAVYNYGGIYLDMDIEIIKPFDELLHDNIMFCFSNNKEKQIESGCFGAEKKSPIIKKVLDYYDGRHFVMSDGNYDTRPIPFIMRDIIHNSFLEIENKIYSSDYFTVNDSSLKKGGGIHREYILHTPL
jgi:mannosyltransferase OCH1-like enzyme